MIRASRPVSRRSPRSSLAAADLLYRNAHDRFERRGRSTLGFKLAAIEEYQELLEGTGRESQVPLLHARFDHTTRGAEDYLNHATRYRRNDRRVAADTRNKRSFRLSPSGESSSRPKQGCCGRRWRVRLPSGWLTISKAVKGAVSSSPIRGTKTRRVRRVPVTEELRAWLESRVAEVPAEERLRGPVALFPNPGATNPTSRWTAGALRKEWAKACKAVGIQVSLYEGTN